MTIARRVFWVAAFWLLAISATRSASACRCDEAEPAAPALAYSRADAVGVARVLSVKPTSAGGTGQIVLEITRAWKADLPSRAKVTTATNCDYLLAEGETHLLFFGHYGAQRAAMRCMGSRPLSEAEPVLKWLETHGRAARVSGAEVKK